MFEALGIIVKKISINVDRVEFTNLYEESDKGCVLLIAALFDEVLGTLHETAINANLEDKIDSQKFIKDKLMNDNCPLYDFANKIKIAFAFNLITEEQYQALYAIRDLRNEAAHCIFHFTLENEGIANYLKKLDGYKKRVFEYLPPKERTTKVLFIEMCHTLLVDLYDNMCDQADVLLAKRDARQ
jgi:hypothetical protein